VIRRARSSPGASGSAATHRVNALDGSRGAHRIDLFSVIVMPGAAADRLALGMLGFWLDPARFVVAGAGVQGPPPTGSKRRMGPAAHQVSPAGRDDALGVPATTSSRTRREFST
jgi:hypothetical protein